MSLKSASEKIIFGFRPVVLAIFALVTVVMAWEASHLQIDAGFKKQIPLQHEYMRAVYGLSPQSTVMPANLCSASAYLARVRAITSAGTFGPGAVLFQSSVSR